MLSQVKNCNLNPAQQISLKSPGAPQRFHFLVPECSLGGRVLGSSSARQFRDHGISDDSEHQHTVTLCDASDIISPEAEAALTRLVGPEMLAECDLLIPDPSQVGDVENDNGNGEAPRGGVSGSESGDADNMDVELPSPAQVKRKRSSSDDVGSRQKGSWMASLTDFFGGKRRKA